MPPRIRSFMPRPFYAREAKSPVPEPPRVFREFVETLQRLDAPRDTGPASSGRAPRIPARKRGYVGNGHKRPSAARSRARSRS